jgi:hypothetical protein
VTFQFTEDVRRRAETITRAWGGDWDNEKSRGRNAACQICGCCAVAVTPGRKGVLLVCNEGTCRAGLGHGDDRLITAARMDGFDCGPGNGRRPAGHKLLPASSDSITGLKRAERRVLKFAAAQTSTGAPFDLARRQVVPACRISDRDFIPLLERLKARGLIRIRSNKYAAKRPTQIAFLVDPVDLSRRLIDPPENGTTPSENGTTVERTSKMVPPPLENGTTMERPDVRTREYTSA